MKIISGNARNLELLVPGSMEVRPTAVRARKALFDSLGPATGVRVLDLFSGSGALALEALSRGAERVFMVEKNPEHLKVIAENLKKVLQTKVSGEGEIISGNALDISLYRHIGKVEWIFADPPYAISGEAFTVLMGNQEFHRLFSGAKLIWEIPNTLGAAENFIPPLGLNEWCLRRFGGVNFLLGAVI